MKNIWITALLSMILGFVSCSGDDPENEIDVEITNISLDKASVTLAVNDETKLVATIISEVSVKVMWKSSDAKVVTVDNEGNIKGIKKGTAVITASAGKKSATCNVTVTDDKINSISIDKTSLTLRTTDRIMLTATTTPATEISVSWSSSDAQVAVVDEKGIVTATGRGTAVITALAGGKTATCDVTVSPSVIIAGNDINDRRFLYKNGEEFEITGDSRTPTTINGVFVYNGNIYIVGTERWSGSVYTAMVTILKSKLPGPYERTQEEIVMETSGTSFGNGLFVSDGDVYVAGEENDKSLNNTDNLLRAVLWKNGKRLYRTINERWESCAYSVYVSVGDVYVAGRLNSRVALWKNGTTQDLEKTPLSGNSLYTEARSVFVSENDIYVAGEDGGGSGWSGKLPALWKNGKLQSIEREPTTGIIYSMYVSGNDVYALGTNDGIIVLWKNGVKHIVYHDATSVLTTLFVYDGDIYAGGSRGFWINEEKQPYGTVGVNTIFVK